MVQNRANTPPVYFEYLFQKNVERFPYPATIHLTNSLQEAATAKPVRGFRPQNVLQIERGKTEFSVMVDSFFIIQFVAVERSANSLCID